MIRHLDNLRRSHLWPIGILLLLSSASTFADVLVTREGERIETDGPWEVRGRQVIFTSASGTLSALRLSEIDLEASELATNPPPAESEPAEPTPEKEPIQIVVGGAGAELSADEVGELFGAMFEGLADATAGMADAFADFSDDPDGVREQIDEANEQAREEFQDMGQGMGELIQTVMDIHQRYPGLSDVKADDPESLREHEAEMRAAADEFRRAAETAESDTGREMFLDAAAQIDAKLEALQ